MLTTSAAWRPVISAGARPAVAVVVDELADPVGEINAQWFQLAVRTGVIGEDGEFLIDVAGNRTGSRPRQWTRVRLTEPGQPRSWDLAGVLGERPGQPEFVTLSVDGEALLGVTTEEYEVWLVSVDRVGAWRDAAAEAEVRETPEEREAAWARLLRGPRPTE